MLTGLQEILPHMETLSSQSFRLWAEQQMHLETEFSLSFMGTLLSGLHQADLLSTLLCIFIKRETGKG